MGNKKERYRENRDRVHDIYGVDKKLRGRAWNMHHQQYRSEGGTDDKGNLISAPVRLHDRIHRGASRQELHEFCESEYGGDPYQGNGSWETQESWGNQPSGKKKRSNRPKKRKGRRKRNKRRR